MENPGNFFLTKIFRSQDIVDGLRAVQRTVAYDKGHSCRNTQPVSRAPEAMGMTESSMDMSAYQSLYNNDQNVDDNCEPTTEYIHENNLQRNFEQEYTTNNKWMLGSETPLRNY